MSSGASRAGSPRLRDVLMKFASCCHLALTEPLPLAPALLVAVSLAVVPYVEIGGTAWCSQVEVDRLSAAVLLLL